MQSISSLVAKLHTDFPKISFIAGDDFLWSPVEAAVYYIPSSSDTPLLLHEVAHAALQHATYPKDIDLVKMESEAWGYAQKKLGPLYGIKVAQETIDESLETYRDWLHARTTCPTCQGTGVEIKKSTYYCLACHSQWKANDGRICALRRYPLTKTAPAS